MLINNFSYNIYFYCSMYVQPCFTKLLEISFFVRKCFLFTSLFEVSKSLHLSCSNQCYEQLVKSDVVFSLWKFIHCCSLIVIYLLFTLLKNWLYGFLFCMLKQQMISFIGLAFINQKKISSISGNIYFTFFLSFFLNYNQEWWFHSHFQLTGFCIRRKKHSEQILLFWRPLVITLSYQAGNICSINTTKQSLS